MIISTSSLHFYLVVDPPRDDGAAVQVDGARRVVAAVEHYHRG